MLDINICHDQNIEKDKIAATKIEKKLIIDEVPTNTSEKIEVLA